MPGRGVTGVLDMDMGTLTRSARAGFDWWLEEIAGMLPARWRAGRGRRAPLIAHSDGRGGFTLTRRGRPVAAPPGKALATVALPPGSGLTRDISMPKLSGGDLRRLLALDADRLMPFAGATALIDGEVIATEPDGRQLVGVAAVPRAIIEAAIEAAEQAAILPRGVALAQPDGSLRFDFLAVLTASGYGRRSARARRIWWSIVGGLIVLNAGVLIARDINATAQLEGLVATHGEAATLARRLRARILAEEARRTALVGRRSTADPLSILADVTRLLPDSAWVQRLTWDGQQLRLSGYQRPDVDVVAALRRSPRFAHARPTTSDVAAASKAGQPFDVTVEQPEARR